MEAAPPSYEQATVINPWDLIAQYIPSNDLCSAALVCEQWHTVFAPHLWGHPASHFGTENDRVYVALTKFKRTLPWARLSVRSLTHTLHLPPAHAEIYYGPHVDWLREVLTRLPNLQSLIVRGLPFFDHAALNALKFLQPVNTTDYRNSQASIFGLRLLDASRCSNLTAASLCQAIGRFPFMLYLDLSFTYPARDHSVLRMLRSMTGLEVLKLRGISLRDEDVEVLATAISTRVRSLDLRNNQLTDRSVRILLDSCFKSMGVHDTSTFSTYRDNSPSLLHYLGSEMLAIYRGEQFEGYFRKSFTTGFVDRLAIEDTPESGTGITHLYVSNNQLTVEGVSGLLRSGRLHVFDVGAVKPDLKNHPLYQKDNSDCTRLPGAEKLTPVLVESAGKALTYLRIDHRLVTQDPMVSDDTDVFPGRVELPDTSSTPVTEQVPVELPDNPVYELPAEPVCELPGDSIHFVLTSAAEEKAPPYDHDYDHDKVNPTKQRRGSADAPEVVQPPQYSDQFSLQPVSAVESSPSSSISDGTALSPQIVPQKGRPRTYSSVVAERADRVKTHVSQSKGFHPGILPCLTTLVLTDVPPFSPTPAISDRLTAFIHDCADEARLAQMQAQLDYSAPPGRKGYESTIRDSARSMFALREIVLEVARDRPTKRKGPASAWRHQDTKSVTQDRDSEALFSAAETDFSFFGEYDHVMPSLESASLPTAMAGLEVAAASDPHSPVSRSPATSMFNESHGDDDSNPQPTRLDVIAKVAEFRKAKKLAYQMQAAYDPQPHVDGCWTGNVKVIRPSPMENPMDEDDEVLTDYYGNAYSNSYLYR